MGLGNSVAFNFSIFGIVVFMYVQFIVFTQVKFMHQSFVSTATIGPGNSRAFKNCILKTLLKPGMAGSNLW